MSVALRACGTATLARVCGAWCGPTTRVCASRDKHTLPDLPYDYSALEPVICAEIMQLHHGKHHQTYVNQLNVAEEKLNEAIARGDTTAALALQPALRFNGGGHINHSIFWQNLRPVGTGTAEPSGPLLQALERDLGGLAVMQQKLSEAAVGVQGSGWAWLGYDPKTARLCVTTCANQDPLQGTTGIVPLFGIDIWEHAYYLQYKNVRPDYVKAIFQLANWEDIAARFQRAVSN